ncbi:phosphoglycerate dehydrogenase-like enzyme [Streptomyces umbrinus]|uniref:Phosphoglycerate dehydrogenase-like enzyme n=1 Tax=Streptomyces umbrinus TaxID=67370 RepID=A0ABU0SH22_9ACTN|nr:hypothetical protein [Streptomyces umbrinus]MDQ1022862.1 phosphoglycerate dehydrogenase-like enzyme [Streptomyces umbrinus]
MAEVREASGTEDQLIKALSGVDICVTQMAPLTERILKACPDLRLFCVSRGGPVNANLEAATRHGVAVSFASRTQRHRHRRAHGRPHDGRGPTRPRHPRRPRRRHLAR